MSTQGEKQTSPEVESIQELSKFQAPKAQTSLGMECDDTDTTIMDFLLNQRSMR